MVIYESEILAENAKAMIPFKIVVEKEVKDVWENCMATRINMNMF